MRYQFIRDYAAVYPITVLCQTLQVTRSGYYAWRQRPVSIRTLANAQLLEQIRAAHRASHATYGSPRVHATLRQQGGTAGRHRVARLMRQHQVIGQRRPKFRVTTDSRHAQPVAANVLERQFTAAQPNRAWVSDITYVPTGEGWLYLAAVMDLASRRIVGWSMAPTLERSLVLEALTAALHQRHPAPGLVLHSDRGSQYASAEYQALLTQHGLVPSMSRKGNCWDNAPMESFFHSLKSECFPAYQFQTRAEARQAIFTFIEVWYNRQRLHSTLGYQTPEMYERTLAA